MFFACVYVYNDSAMKKYDFLIVGAGLFAATCAHELNKRGYKVLVVEKRNNIAGNIYTEEIEGIQVHKYGPHIFHTSNKVVWDYLNQFIKFNDYINMPIAYYKGKYYNMPFNMNTFHQVFGVNTPEEARERIESEIKEANIKEPKNLEEKAISMVGKTIYEMLVKGYTQKQWGRPCNELPPFIISRLPVRYEYNNNYFNDIYQGIPIGGFTKMVANMLNGIEVRLGVDYLENKDELDQLADQIIYTGEIDKYFNYCYGALEWRSLRFEEEVLDQPDYQGVAVVNYTEYEIPYTRIAEHKYFDTTQKSNKTVITKEYSKTWSVGDEAYYPINDQKNGELYAKYKELAEGNPKVHFGGRLGTYSYYNMDVVVEKALQLVEQLVK